VSELPAASYGGDGDREFGQGVGVTDAFVLAATEGQGRSTAVSAFNPRGPAFMPGGSGTAGAVPVRSGRDPAAEGQLLYTDARLLPYRTR
jgi:hypothetical protein